MMPGPEEEVPPPPGTVRPFDDAKSPSVGPSSKPVEKARDESDAKGETEAEPPISGDAFASLSFGLPEGLSSPVDQHDLGKILFVNRCLAFSEMQLDESVVEKLAKRYEPVIRAHYLAAYSSAEDADRFEVRLRAASASADGHTTLLVTFEDTDTGNFVLPLRRAVEGPEGKQWTCTLEGGATYFQGLLLTYLGARQGEDEKSSLRFRESYLCPDFVTVGELSRLSWGDFRTPFSSELSDVLVSHECKLEDVHLIKSASDFKFAHTFMRYLLYTDNATLLVGLGDIAGAGVVRVEFGLRFENPPVGALEESDDEQPRPSEGILSTIQDIAIEDGDVVFESPAMLRRFHLDTLTEVLTAELSKRMKPGTWPEDWKLEVHAPRVSPSGTIRLALSIEDSSGRYQLPWLSSQEVQRVLSSKIFIGIGVEMVLPSPLAPSGIPGEGSNEGESPVEIGLSHAYVTRRLMDREVRRLAHRELLRTHQGEKSQEFASESPSALARESALFPELESAVTGHLVEMGCITPAQVPAVELRNILVATDRKVAVAEGVDVDFYLVHVEHQWGTHVIRFTRVDELGCVAFFGSALVFGFFPRNLQSRRSIADTEPPQTQA